MLRLAPQNVKDRFEAYRFFNGISEEATEGINQRRTRVPFVKTFLLESVSSHQNRPPSASEIFDGFGVRLRRVDDTFFAVEGWLFDRDNNRSAQTITGFLEQYDKRFFAYYTSESAKDAKKRVATWIQYPDLDATWYSGPLLQALWDKDVSGRGDHRFGKLVFNHESIFEMPEDFAISISQDEDDEEETSGQVEEDLVEIDRRKARFEMADRIGRIRRSLTQLQKNYDPLHALYALRFPSMSARGSHDLYQSGQITNRTDSFEDHRNTVRYLWRIYKSILESTERSAWHKIKPERSLQTGVKGVPLIVKFEERLPQATFDRWIQLGFQKRNRFKLWGDPIRLGPTKVHVYGADRHLWQPINLEITADQLVAILPVGTCGNTFHRLVTNIQHYVSPKIRAWVGAEAFETLVSAWPTVTDQTS